MKKVLCVFIVLAQVLGSIVALAENEISYALNCDFTNATGKYYPNSGNTPFENVDGMSITGVGNHTKFYQAVIAGADDKYLRMSYESGWQPYSGYLEANKSFTEQPTGNINVEFTFLAQNYARNFMALGKFSTSQYSQGLVNMDTDGKIYFWNEAVMDYQLNTWYHFAININTTAKTMTLYVDGEQLATANLSWLSGAKLEAVYFRLSANPNNAVDLATKWIDDIKVYAHSTFDDAFPLMSAYITSDTFRIVPAENTIVLSKAVSKSEFLSGIDAASGATIAIFDSNGLDITQTAETISGDMMVKVTSQNKKIVRTYTVSTPDLYSDVYVIDYTEKKISGVSAYTKIDAFISNIESSVGLSVIRDGAPVTDGYITADMTVTCNGVSYQIDIEKGAFDENFDQDVVGQLPTGSTINNIGSVKPAQPFTVEENAQKGSQAMRYHNDAFDTTSGSINVSYAQRGFNYEDNANIEFSFMAEDYNTTFHVISKDKNDSIWLPGLELKDGKVYYNNNEIGEYALNRWYHFVISFDFPMSVEEYAHSTIYMNGEVLSPDAVTSLPYTIGNTRFEFRNATGSASTIWLDDLREYQLGTYTYEAETEGTKCTVTSEMFTIDNLNATIDLKGTICTPADVDFVYSENIADDILLYDTDNTLIESSDVTLVPGMTMVVRSNNGKVIKYYDFIDSEQSEQDILAVYDDSANKVNILKEGNFTAVANPEGLQGEKMVMIVALYDADGLINCQLADVSETDIAEFTVGSEVTEVRVFLWDMNTLQPLTKHITLK